jgi:hypothetical protein
MSTPHSPLASRRQLLLGGGAAAASLVLAPSPLASAVTAPAIAPGSAGTSLGTGSTRFEKHRLLRWAADTMRSLERMTFPATGLPSDNIRESLALADASHYTSPTNIGGWMWSNVVARDLGLITPGECNRRIRRTLTTLLRMEHHEPSGMYYNWYDPKDGSVIRQWPVAPHNEVNPFVSSVDNGWLGAALQVVRTAVPGARHLAEQLWHRMRWDMFYDPDARTVNGGGLIHGGFYTEKEGPGTFLGNHIGIGPDVWYTTHHYDTTVSETRITTYLGLIRGQIPPQNYYALWRTFPATCDWNWQEMQPVGVTRTYYGLEVFEGAYTYRGMRIVPGWGGSMFEELMPAIFVPEERWAPYSWGINHPLHVRAQREHGLVDAKYGYWGFSPSSDPFVVDGYREYGVDALGLNPDGYFSDEEKTNYDVGFDDCRPATNPNPTYKTGVVTPHAAFLAMMFEPREAYQNLLRIQYDLRAYGRGGFFDAASVRGDAIARRYLSLDQAMIIGAIGNVVGGGALRRSFSTREVERAVRPVIGIERFGAGLG